ncbi:GspH/FimT family pseudopilin [Acinetobacter sp. NIPH1876]|uniref:GspH/FimT family pseudopilin n=1 Tax=unclassified Acinetobacter TaxID=196816 RepID=UPI001FAB5973|nr:GspH/FimT family pseudopilin [Acinetobacter sp. NIPH1876]MCJ0829127.1 GspH/FimT family pseudopilin [Acinetobacter sp. NIPH1876]
MQQAHDDLQSRAQTEHSFTDPSTRSIASRLGIGLSVVQLPPCNFERSSPSCVQTKQSFVHFRSGFTLVELIITIAVLAIIVLMAAPSFATMYSRQKLESSARELVMKISEARSQAVLLRQSTGVCLASLSNDDCATAIAIPKAETQRIFIARLDHGVTSANSSSTNLSFRRNGSLAAQKNFILERQNLSYCIQVGVIGDTTVKEGACT